MSRTNPTHLQIASIIILLIEFGFLAFEAVMVGLMISNKDDMKASLLEQLKDNPRNDPTMFETEEQQEKVEAVIDTVIIPVIFGIYVVVFACSLVLTCVLAFGVTQKRPACISVWICFMTVFLILNLIYLLPAIIFVPNFLSQVQIVNVVHQIYRVIAVLIICFYSRQLRRHVMSGQSGEVYTVQYHIPPEQ